MEAIYNLLSQYPTPPKEWAYVDRRSKPFFNQVIRNSMPSLSTTQRSKMLEYIGPLLAKEFRPRLETAKQRDLVELARDLQTNESFQTTLKHYKTTLEQSMGMPLSQVDAGANQLDSQLADNGAHKLRSRFLLPTNESMRETIAQSMHDVVEADLFDFRTPNEELGQNNALYIDNLRNERMRFMQPTVPRNGVEQLVAIAPVLPQWTGDFDMEDAIHDKLRDEVIQEGMKQLPPFSLALKDTTNLTDPFGNYRPNSYMEPINDLGPGYQKDFTQGVMLGELDARGFKPDYDPLRNPREPSRMEVVPIQSKQDQLGQIYRQGFDYVFSTGFYVQPPTPGPIDLKGFQWI